MFRMSRLRWFIVFLSIAPIGLGAQTAGQTAPSGAVQPAKDTKITLTVVGCVKRAEVEAANGPIGSASDSGTHFVLTDVTAATAEKPAVSSSSNNATGAVATGTTGKAVPNATGGGLAPTFRLEATEETLTPHLGHKVEIAGSPEVHAGVPITSGSSPSPVSAPKLIVDSIKPIAGACP